MRRKEILIRYSVFHSFDLSFKITRINKFQVLTVAILENIKLRCWELIDEKAKVTDDAKEGLFLFLSPVCYDYYY